MQNNLRELIVAEARTWLDVPFLHQGRTRRGIDCVGLPDVVSANVEGGPLTERRAPVNYGRLPRPDKMLVLLDDYLIRIPMAEALPGDMVYMINQITPQHLAMVTDIGIIHAYAQAGKVVEHGMDIFWRDTRVAAFRYPKLASWHG